VKEAVAAVRSESPGASVYCGKRGWGAPARRVLAWGSSVRQHTEKEALTGFSWRLRRSTRTGFGRCPPELDELRAINARQREVERREIEAITGE